jgi:hypothetical protein
MRKDKKGAEKYYILISLILGLLLIGIIFSWIFQEYFFGEEIMDLQKCKQSIITRSAIPNFKKLGMTFVDFKEEFPLECKTQKIIINKKNQEEANKTIADAMAACWALFNQGEVTLYGAPGPTQNVPTNCWTCARIVFDPEVKDLEIDVKQMLLEDLDNKRTYLQYLTYNSQNPSLNPDNLKEDFKITAERNIGTDTSKIYYPGKINSNDGDLHITLSSWIISEKETMNQLFFYQKAKENLIKLTNANGDHTISNAWINGMGQNAKDISAACSGWDGINV